MQESNQGDAAANLERIEQRVGEAASAGAQLVLLQELHNGAYFCQHECVDEFDLAEPIPGPSTDRLGKLAAPLGRSGLVVYNGDEPGRGGPLDRVAALLAVAGLTRRQGHTACALHGAPRRCRPPPPRASACARRSGRTAVQ